MHPIMSDLDITIRQFERTQERQNFHHQLLARDVARLNGRLGPLGRLSDAIREFIDPRGFALNRVRQAELQHGTVGSMQFTSAATTARFHAFPAIISKDREQSWRKAA